MQVVFNECELDVAAFELKRDGDVVPLEPQVLAVICHLVEHRDRVVTKNELLDEIWGDRFVSESALTSRIRDARRAVGDDGTRQAVIKTIHGRGYRFIADATPVPTTQIPDGSSSLPEGDGPRPRPGTMGRDRDLADLVERVRVDRMVSVIGPGGIGKTHLLGDLRAVVGAGYDEVALVELATVTDPDAIDIVVAEAVGAKDTVGGSMLDSILHHIGDRPVLLLIDNAEHLRTAVADLCRSVLRNCPNARLVVTSQQRLNVIGESLHPLGGLEPDAAVDLFVACARRAGARVDPESTALAELCTRLDGIPLAIELAAALTRVLSIGDVNRRIEGSLGSHRTEDDDRHSSVEAALRWSLDTLPDADRALLEDLSVFTGPFDLDGVSAVSPSLDVAGSLFNLVDHSLVVAMADEQASWFRLLEPVRWFARRKHADVTSTEQRHAALYVDRACRNNDLLATTAVDRGFDGFHADWSNTRSAVAHLVERRDLELLTRIVVAVLPYAEHRSAREVRDWARTAARFAAEQQTEPAPSLIAARVRLAGHAGDLAAAEALAATIAPEAMSVDVWQARLVVAHYRGDIDEADRCAERSWEATLDQQGLFALGACVGRVFLAASRGSADHEAADRLAAVGRRCGRIGELYVRFADAARADWSGERAAAVARFDDAIAYAESIRMPFLAQSIATYRSLAIVSLDDPQRAAEAVANSIVRGLDTGAWALVASDLAIAAKTMVDLGHPVHAAQILAARESSRYRLPATDWVAALMTAVIEEALGEVLDRHLAAGAQLDLESAARIALDHLASGVG